MSEARRFNVVCCGRRFGKSTLGINRLTPALEGYPVAWFSPTYGMLTEIWRETKNAYHPLTVRKDESRRRLELSTGGVIEFWSLENFDAVRGRKYKHVVVDEAAMVRYLQEAWQAVVRPTLTDFEGSADFFSTPKGMNFFKTLYDWGQDPARADWMSWQMPTLANPYIKPSEIESARLDQPERTFAQEYLAQFLDDAGGVFRRVLASTTAELQEKPLAGHHYVFGVDWGKQNDFTVISVIDTDLNEQCYLERFNQIDYALQTQRLEALVERFKPEMVLAEKNSIGDPLIEQLSRKGMMIRPFNTTNASKTLAIEALALDIEKGSLRLLADPVQTAELQAYEAERLPSGMTRYSAPAGMHDDTVMALAIANQARREPGLQLF